MYGYKMVNLPLAQVFTMLIKCIGGKTMTKITSKALPKYTLSEELFNSISHGVGAGLSVAALVLCIIRAAIHGETAAGVVGASIYGATLVILYCMSTLYHALTNETARKVFRVFDHTSIYLLIAGTYTPITLVTLRGALGWTLFGIVWGIAIPGIVFNSISIEKFKKISLVSYIIMGWAIIIGAKDIIEKMPRNGLIFLLLGGIAYTVGIIFYVLKKKKFMHSVWHFFVLAGSILQFFAIYFYVLPTKLF